MPDKNTDFLKITNNFAKIADIVSIPIIEASIDYIPKVTIAIPTFKRADMLKEAIDSAIHQVGYLEYDIIVVDNDPERNCETEQLIESYNDSRLSYYKNSVNIQMAGNWNRCFELAVGKYVVMLHDDDVLLPTFIKECMGILHLNKNIGILKPYAYVLRDSDEILSNLTPEPDKVPRLQRLYDFSNFNEFILGAPTGCLYNKADLISVGGFNQDFYPIMDFCLAVVFSQYKAVYNYNKKLSIYRISINESLKLSTLISSYENSFYLTQQILRKYRIPNCLINKHLSCKFFHAIAGHKSLNSNFDCDLKTLGLKYPTKIQLFFDKVFVFVLNNVMHFLFSKRIKIKSF